MAKFEGTIQEFHEFLGPRIRNKVNNLTRVERKKQNGKCQHCGEPGELQSAHVHGRERRAIIEEMLSSNKKSDDSIVCDILEVEKKILDAHLPIKETFLFLCPNCHLKYDAKFESDFPKESKSIDSPKIKEVIPSVVKQISIEKTHTDGGTMTNSQLQDAIKAIGKECFVTYFEKFKNLSISNEDIIELLMREKGFTENSCRTRISKSRKIIELGHAKDILSEIADSSRLENHVKDKARALLRKYYS